LSIIKREVEQCMTALEAVVVQELPALTARFTFPEDFIGFQGHFPGNKILPGVCQIQCALTMLEKWKNRDVILKEIVHAKFFSTVVPSEEFACVCKGIEATDADFILKAHISNGDKKISELKLKVRFKQSKNDE
jgi:3-hydroxyacyl-[acyl-carrier-protein] dehydratase